MSELSLLIRLLWIVLQFEEKKDQHAETWNTKPGDRNTFEDNKVRWTCKRKTRSVHFCSSMATPDGILWQPASAPNLGVCLRFYEKWPKPPVRAQMYTWCAKISVTERRKTEMYTISTLASSSAWQPATGFKWTISDICNLPLTSRDVL